MTLKTILAAALAASSALAQGLAHPAGLQPGDEYRVLFVTDGTRDATSSDIADYDAFVTADANAVPFLAALNTGWRAVGSTPTVAAKYHTDTVSGGVPIFRPDGVRVADDYDHLWDAANTPFLAAPEVTAGGVLTSGLVWTGSMATGNAGSWPLGGVAGQALIGNAGHTTTEWMLWGTQLATFGLRVYGLSDVLTVPYPDYPRDLKPGDQFRILFVTDSIRDATSSNIADYDDFVTADAQAVSAMSLFGTNWRALASTASVWARTHTETSPMLGGVPIYRPDGVRVANNYGHLWGTFGGSPLLASPSITASGAVAAVWAWTGTNPNGTGDPTDPLGNNGGYSYFGGPLQSNAYWITYGGGYLTTARAFYGISDVITVPLPAVEQSRVGTPPNADALLPGQTSGPVIGRTWDPIVDHTTFVTNAAIDVLFFGTAQANVPLPGLGTVLCSQLLGANLTALPGQTFSLSIPNSSSLVGVSLSTQALSLDLTWGMHLTNALDITIGTR